MLFRGNKTTSKAGTRTTSLWGNPELKCLILLTDFYWTSTVGRFNRTDFYRRVSTGRFPQVILSYTVDCFQPNRF